MKRPPKKNAAIVLEPKSKFLKCLTPDAINSRFVDTTSYFTDQFFKALIKEDPRLVRQRIDDTMEKHKCSEKKARQIIKKERAAWSKHYDSPLGKAERRIEELESHLRLIKDVVANPDHCDCP